MLRPWKYSWGELIDTALISICGLAIWASVAAVIAAALFQL
jgi:hypothetical protein